MAPLLKKLAPIQINHAQICLSIDAVKHVQPSEKNRTFVTSKKISILKPEGTKRIKPMVLEILEKHTGGLKALDILSAIETDYDVKIMRTSLSPQLSRLKKSGAIENRGKLWFLLKEKPPAVAEGLNDKGAGWNQRGSPNPQPAGSIPVASTPNFEDRKGSQNLADEATTSSKIQPLERPERK